MAAPNITMAKDLDGVIRELEKIIDWAYHQGSRLGFFPALYQQVTLDVKRGSETNAFEDGSRMERLVVSFANRYLEAFQQYHSGEQPTLSWKVAFEAAKDPRFIILQHLLLGINAHINLDLSLACASISSAENIDELKGDFDHINTVLSNLIDDTQEKLGNYSPWMTWLDNLAEKIDENLTVFTLKTGRAEAWKNALRLVRYSDEEKEKTIRHLDQTVADIAGFISKKSWVMRLLVWVVQLRESKDVQKVIEGLRASG